MLIKQEYRRGKKSIYACDICNTKMTVDDTNKISRQNKKKNQKIFDLCEECCKLAMRDVEKLKKLKSFKEKD